MPTSGGPNYNRSGLVFSVDPMDVQNSVPAIGCGAFSGAPSIECQISKVGIPFINSVTLTGKNQFWLDCGKEENQEDCGLFLKAIISLMSIPKSTSSGPVTNISYPNILLKPFGFKIYIKRTKNMKRVKKLIKML